jgi:hypothetical protein
MLQRVTFVYYIPDEALRSLGDSDFLSVVLLKSPEEHRPFLETIAAIHRDNPAAISYENMREYSTRCTAFAINIDLSKITKKVMPLSLLPATVFVPAPSLKIAETPGRRLNFRCGVEVKEPAK